MAPKERQLKKSNPNCGVTLGELERRPELLAELLADPEVRQVFAAVQNSILRLRAAVRVPTLEEMRRRL